LKLTLKESILRRDELSFALLLSARASEFVANFDSHSRTTPHAVLLSEDDATLRGLKDVHALFQQKVIRLDSQFLILFLLSSVSSFLCLFLFHVFFYPIV
jgi:hypothetical protein